jgi:hypothetical protein
MSAQLSCQPATNGRLCRRSAWWAALALGLVAVSAVLAGCAGKAANSLSPEADALSLTKPQPVITNEFAYWNPKEHGIHTSSEWQMDSGSLFSAGAYAWTGVPDAVAPNADSTNGNNSAVFRLVTRRSDFGDVTVSFSLINLGLVSTSKTPADDWDGVHVFLRYQSEQNLYYVSVNRRDNKLDVKKKVAGGSVNGGTYYILAEANHQVAYGSDQAISTSIVTNSDKSVTISLTIDGQEVLHVTDDGSIGGPPILNAGRVGIRGDNDNFLFRTFSTKPADGRQ